MGFFIENNTLVKETKQSNERIIAIGIRKSHANYSRHKKFSYWKETKFASCHQCSCSHLWASLNQMRSKLLIFVKTTEDCQKIPWERCHYSRWLQRETSKRNHMEDAVGSHVRGERKKENGDSFQDLIFINRYLASTTCLKRKACHITTFEHKRDKFTIYNQIDYIFIKHYWKSSLKNARSYKIINSTLTIDSSSQIYGRKLNAESSNYIWNIRNLMKSWTVGETKYSPRRTAHWNTPIQKWRKKRGIGGKRHV